MIHARKATIHWQKMDPQGYGQPQLDRTQSETSQKAAAYDSKRNMTACFRWRYLSFARHFLILFAVSIATPSWAQTADIVPDETLLPAETSTVRAGNGGRIQIEGGARRGSNLFHSFEAFNVDMDQRVYFNPDMAVENVLSRVTGRNPSNILGTLGVNGSADLWLVNPNGIVFGEASRLDMSGAFRATTGTGIPLGASTFSATEPAAEQLLVIAPNTSFSEYINSEYIDESSGDITIRDLSIVRRAQQNGPLAFTGRNVSIDDVLRTNGDLSIFAYDSIIANNTINTSRQSGGGNVELVARGDITTNGINSSAAVGSLNAGNGGSLSLTTLAGGHILNRGDLNSRTNSDGGGPPGDAAAMGDGGVIALITEQGGNIVNRGVVRSQSRSTGGEAGNGGSVTMAANGGGDIVNERAVRSQSDALVGDSGNAGAIAMSTANGSIRNRDDVNTQSSSQTGAAGNGGSVSIRATGDIENAGTFNTYSFSRDAQATNGGAVSMAATAGGSITNQDDIRSISASNGGDSGNGGDITLTAVGRGSIANYGALNAQSLANGSGENGGSAMGGGNITMTTEQGDITNRSLSAEASPDNNDGSLNTRSVARESRTGNAGDIEVRSLTGNIVLNAYLDAKSYSLSGVAANGGGVTLVTAGGSITSDRDRTNIITSAVSSGSADPVERFSITEGGNGGNVRLRSGQTISGFSLFTLSNVGQSGDVTFEGTGNLQIEDTQIVTNEEIVAGSFSFDENPLFPSNLSTADTDREGIPITITTPTTGQPGDVLISSNGDLSAVNLQVSNDASSPADESNADAGDITRRGPAAIRLTNSRLATNTINTGTSGDITLADANTVVLSNTVLITNTAGLAPAGSIEIDGFNYLLMTNGSLLLADAQGAADGGTIEINSNLVVASPDGNNDIIVNASAGDGGAIFSPEATLYGFEQPQGLTTSDLRSRRSNDISASSESGQDGVVTLNALTNAPIRAELEELSEDFATPDQLISNSCISRNQLAEGSFVIPGAGALPSSPDDATASEYSLGDIELLPSEGNETALNESPNEGPNESRLRGQREPWKLGDPVVEPERVARAANGRIVFGRTCSAS